MRKERPHTYQPQRYFLNIEKMDFILTQKFKIILIIATSTAGFAYFKYIKKIDMGWKIGLSLGCIMLAIGCISASMAYSPERVANIFLLYDDAPAGLEKMVLMGHIFVLFGLISLVDKGLNKIFKIEKEK